MIGAIIGDIVGSRFEHSRMKSKDFEFFTKDSKITDDTICTLACTDWMSNDQSIDPEVVLRYWCQKYFHIGGWGARFHEWICNQSKGPYNSCGNGSAMRCSPIAVYGDIIGPQTMERLVDKFTNITHNHPESIRAVRLYTKMIAHCYTPFGTNIADLWKMLMDEYGDDLRERYDVVTVDCIRKSYKYTELVQLTFPEAMVCVLDGKDFQDSIRNAVSLGGDADTLACIAGGLAEALYGIPEEFIGEAMDRLDRFQKRTICDLYTSTGRKIKLV